MVVRRHFLAVVSVVVPLAVAACDGGGSSGQKAATDTNATDALSSDNGGTTGTTTSAPDTHVTLPDGFARAGFTSVSSIFDAESGLAFFQAQSAAEEPMDLLQIEIYQEGYVGAADGPGTYPMTDNYETCANCIVIRTACSKDDGCAKTFYADKGDMVIEQWDVNGGRFKGHLADLELTEVTIDKESFVSTPVPGGEKWIIANYAFDAEVKALPVSDKTQETCVAAGTGNLLHDNVADLTLKNCNGEDVHLHATCGGQSEALWIIGTAGWCTACHEFLEAFRLKHTEGQLTRDVIAKKTPGLDMVIILGENEDGEKPTEAYCKAYAEDMKIDPTMVLLDWSDADISIPLVDPEGYSITTNALGASWQVINPYLQADSEGGVTTAYPWWAILKAPNMEYIWSDGGQLVPFESALESLLGRFPSELFD